MKLYAIYKDGILYKASYDQNTPFYETIRGAEAAIKSRTIGCLDICQIDELLKISKGVE